MKRTTSRSQTPVWERQIFGFLFLLGLAFSAWAGDSPQFRGQGGLGLASENAMPVHWSARDNIRWKASLPGRGLSCPVVVGNRVLVTACTGVNQDRLHVLCFQADSGKLLWQRQLWATGNTMCHDKTCMAAPTPVSDGQRIYALFATCDLACFDLDGNLIWFRSLSGDYPTIGNNVGMASSPVLWKDLLIVCLENVGASFAAGIDKHTGQNRWKVPRSREINWVTPFVFTHKDGDQVLFQGPKDLSAHDPATGRKIWALPAKFLTIPTPVSGNGLILAPGEKFYALRPAPSSDQPERVWESNKLPTGYASPLYHKGLVYALSAGGVLNCADAATGKPVYSQRLEGRYAASPLLADGKLYLVSESGSTTVVQAGKKPVILATNSLEETFLASPVAAAGALFLRSDKHLYCIGQEKK